MNFHTHSRSHVLTYSRTSYRRDKTTASLAIKGLQNAKIGGKDIKVSWSNHASENNDDPAPLYLPLDADERIKLALATAAAIPTSGSAIPVAAPVSNAHLTMNNTTAPFPTSTYVAIAPVAHPIQQQLQQQQQHQQQQQQEENYSLHGEESISINDGGRAALMAKLAARAGMSDMVSKPNAAALAGLPGASAIPMQQPPAVDPATVIRGANPTNCLLIRNCFDKNKETEPGERASEASKCADCKS